MPDLADTVELTGGRQARYEMPERFREEIAKFAG
jgi:hypothetical protein